MNIKGYKVNFLGDSITVGVGVSDVQNCRYDNRIAKMLELFPDLFFCHAGLFHYQEIPLGNIAPLVVLFPPVDLLL